MSAAFLGRIESALKSCVHLLAQSLGATAEAEVQWIFPPTINDDAQAELVLEVCSNIVGPDAVHCLDSIHMASDDFGYPLERVGGCYFNIGKGSESHSCEVHPFRRASGSSHSSVLAASANGGPSRLDWSRISNLCKRGTKRSDRKTTCSFPSSEAAT